MANDERQAILAGLVDLTATNPAPPGPFGGPTVSGASRPAGRLAWPRPCPSGRPVALHDALHQHVHLAVARPRGGIDGRLPGSYRLGDSSRTLHDGAPGRSRVAAITRRRGRARIAEDEMDPVRPAGRFHEHHGARDRRRLRAAPSQREHLRLRRPIDAPPNGAVVMHNAEPRRAPERTTSRWSRKAPRFVCGDRRRVHQVALLRNPRGVLRRAH